MKTYLPADIRNFAIVGHASCGKTTLSEAMLYSAGEIARMGTIEAGSTVSDYDPVEQERRYSIHATPLHLEWQGKKFNLIDTPGYLDFVSEGLSSLRVVDFALIVIHAAHGIGVGTQRMWDYATRYKIPKVFVVNALDKENVDFDRLIEQVRERFGANVFAMQVPVNAGPGFNQVLDVLRSEVVSYPADHSPHYEEKPASGVWKTRVETLHRELIEHVAESDDTLLERYIEEGGLSEELMRSGIHPAIQKQVFVPLFCVSASNNVGVARLMDFIAKFGSSPVDRESVEATTGEGAPTEVKLSAPDPCLYVFRTHSEPQSGDLSFFRVYSGSVHVGMDLYNADRKTTERLGQLYLLNGKNRASAGVLNAGDIGAAVKLKDTHTGNTLCDPKHVVSLPKVACPKPNLHAALVINSKGDEDKVAQGLAMLHEEDPAFAVHTDGELHQTLVSAQGELHLEVIGDRLRRRYKANIDFVPPRIRFRETIRAKADAKYRHKKQTGGAGQFAEVWMRIEPLPHGSGFEFTQSLSGQNVDRVFVPSVEKGVQSACAEGILAGYRVVDVRVDFYDGKMHPVDSKDIAFQIAGYFAFKEAFTNARPCLLEPIHALEIRVPEEFLGKIMGDLSSRRGKILGIEADGVVQCIKAHVPAMELHHYAAIVRSLTGGCGEHTEEFDHYEEMPREIEQRVVAESRKAKEAATH